MLLTKIYNKTNFVFEEEDPIEIFKNSEIGNTFVIFAEKTQSGKLAAWETGSNADSILAVTKSDGSKTHYTSSFNNGWGAALVVLHKDFKIIKMLIEQEILYTQIFEITSDPFVNPSNNFVESKLIFMNITPIVWSGYNDIKRYDTMLIDKTVSNINLPSQYVEAVRRSLFKEEYNIDGRVPFFSQPKEKDETWFRIGDTTQRDPYHTPLANTEVYDKEHVIANGFQNAESIKNMIAELELSNRDKLLKALLDTDTLKCCKIYYESPNVFHHNGVRISKNRISDIENIEVYLDFYKEMYGEVAIEIIK